MSLKKALLAATVLALPVAAQAQPVSGLYVGGGVGLNFLQNSDVSLGGAGLGGLTAAQRSGTVEFNPGYAVILSLGYGYGNGIRAEIEANFRSNEVDQVSGFGIAPGATRPAGTVRSFGVMGNALYDFDVSPLFTPYIGLGAGYVVHEYSRVRAGTGTVTTIDGNEGRFAYQAILGAAVPLTSVAPGLSLTAEYRFLGTLSPEIDSSVDHTSSSLSGPAASIGVARPGRCRASSSRKRRAGMKNMPAFQRWRPPARKASAVSSLGFSTKRATSKAAPRAAPRSM